MDTDMLEQAIKETESELKGRESRKLIGWAAVTLLLFLIPIVLFFQLSPDDSAYETSYAPIVIVWLMVTMGVGNVVATAMLAPRTTELRLSLATATALLTLMQSREPVAETQPMGIAENR